MGKAITVRSGCGSVRIPIFANRDGARVRFELRYRDEHGIKHRRKKSTLAAARTEARTIADALATGNRRAEFTAADVASFRSGVLNLLPTGQTMALATADYAAAWLKLRASVGTDSTPSHESIPTLATVVDEYLKHRPSVAADLTVPAAVAALLAAKLKKGVSPRWHGTLRSQLQTFAAAHPGPIAAVTAEAIEHWILSRPVTATTRNNYLAAIQSLYTLPALAHAPHRAAVLALTPSARPAAAVLPESGAIWTPEQFRTLLTTALRPFPVLNQRTRANEMHSHRHLLPVLVLGGFCKLRSESEVMRARWENVSLKDRQIYTTGKTGERLATLTPNAVAWLKLIATTAGPIWPWGENKLHRDLRALARRCELEWRPNALRKSAATYAMKLAPDASTISADAGNSPTVLRRYYLKLRGITKAHAKAWFAILPPKNGRIIVPMQTATA